VKTQTQTSIAPAASFITAKFIQVLDSPISGQKELCILFTSEGGADFEARFAFKNIYEDGIKKSMSRLNPLTTLKGEQEDGAL
jgi:hypothetical protein